MVSLRRLHETVDGEIVERATGVAAWRQNARMKLRQRAWRPRTHLGFREDPECGALVHGIDARMKHEQFHDNLIEIFSDLVDRITFLEEQNEQMHAELVQTRRELNLAIEDSE